MALDAKVDAFLIQSTDIVGTTIAVTGLGFQPEALVVWYSGRGEGVDTLGRADIHAGIGYASAPTERGVSAGFSEDGVATTNLNDADRVDALIETTTPADAVDGLADLSSFDADGFTIIIDDQFSADLRVHFLALGGTDLLNAKVGNITGDGTTGNLVETGLGFQPDLVLFHGVATGSGPPSLFRNMQWAFGAMISAAQQGKIATGSRDNVATTASASLAHFGTECWSTIRYSPGAVDHQIDFVSMDADGFTVDQITSDNDRIHYLALELTNAAIGEMLTRTDGADIVVSGLGFQPSAVLFFSHNGTEDAVAGGKDDAILSLGGASDPTERGAQYRMDIDGLGTSRVATAVEFDAVYIRTDEAAAPAIDGLMDLKSLDADGFTCVMDDPDPSAAFVMWVAVGPGGVAPPAAPSDVACVTFSSSRIDVSWTDNSTNEDGFRIERAPTAVGPWTTAGSVGPNVTSFMDMGLPASTEFFYRVFAVNAGGDSPASNVSGGCTTDPTPPGPGRHEPGSWLRRYLAGRIFGGRRLGNWID